MKISELKSPYRELAELRRGDRSLDGLGSAFNWRDTIEGHFFWKNVNQGECPAIPSESLKELKQIDMKDLIGKKVKGFKFEGGKYNGLSYECYMDKHIGEVGEITKYYPEGYYNVRFNGCDWCYPASLIEEYLVEEWEIGKEYEFTHESMGGWVKKKLLAILPDEYKDRYIVSSGVTSKGWTYMSAIRHIEPKVKEVTLEDIAEKFGVSVESIKIKK